MDGALFAGKNLIELDTVDSTNNYAKQLLTNTAPPEGTAILAREQHAGRGQMGNIWLTEPGQNLTASFILYPRFLDADKQFYLNMAVALAVKDCCEAFLRDEVKIKWPNDIYYNDKKLAGILIENTVSGSKITSSVAGIGLNVNQQQFPEGLPNPTSLYLEGHKPLQIKEVLNQLSACLEKYYLQLRQLHYNFLDRAYTDSLYRYQQTHEFKKGDHVFKGEVNGVTKDGKLIIHSNGKEMRFAFKEVEFLI